MIFTAVIYFIFSKLHITAPISTFTIIDVFVEKFEGSTFDYEKRERTDR